MQSPTPETGMGELDYDGVLDSIGQFGPFQRRIFFTLWLV